MKMFLFKCVVLICTLMVGILLGMQKANDGMVFMKGYEEASFPSPVHMNKTEDGELEAAVLGKPLDIKGLEEKKEKLEEMETFNFFSSLGKTLADAVSAIAQKILTGISELLQK